MYSIMCLLECYDMILKIEVTFLLVKIILTVHPIWGLKLELNLKYGGVSIKENNFSKGLQQTFDIKVNE